MLKAPRISFTGFVSQIHTLLLCAVAICRRNLAHFQNVIGKYNKSFSCYYYPLGKSEDLFSFHSHMILAFLFIQLKQYDPLLFVSLYVGWWVLSAHRKWKFISCSSTHDCKETCISSGSSIYYYLKFSLNCVTEVKLEQNTLKYYIGFKCIDFSNSVRTKYLKITYLKVFTITDISWLCVTPGCDMLLLTSHD